MVVRVFRARVAETEESADRALAVRCHSGVRLFLPGDSPANDSERLSCEPARRVWKRLCAIERILAMANLTADQHVARLQAEINQTIERYLAENQFNPRDPDVLRIIASAIIALVGQHVV
jgi:hypothetical protein